MSNVTEILAQDITPEFVLSNSTLSEYMFGHVPGFTRYSVEREAEGKQAWEAYKNLRAMIHAYVKPRFLQAVENWNAPMRFEKAKNIYPDMTASKPYGMWGSTTKSYQAGAGMRFVDCVGHGGFLTCKAREAGIPPVFRQGFTYEEDVNLNIIAVFYPGNFFKCRAMSHLATTPENREKAWNIAVDSVIDWHLAPVVQFANIAIEELPHL